MKAFAKPILNRKSTHETAYGVAPTLTVGESYPHEPVSKAADIITLFKPRVTSLIVLTSWACYYLAERKSGGVQLHWGLLAILGGIAMVAASAAALNQALEYQVDARMSRTSNRPLPSKRMELSFALALGVVIGIFGALLLAFSSNILTGALSLLTSLTYVFIYTPMKTRSSWSTFVGAFPGAMPAVLGWTAATGKLGWEAGALFAIVFFWQFPHFLAIAWLYREDYERAGIRMLPVVESTGKATLRQILGYGALLLPVSLIPFFLGMAGKFYFAGAIVLGLAYLWFGIRLAMLRLPPAAAHSKKDARRLLQASVVYLPLLLILLMVNGAAR